MVLLMGIAAEFRGLIAASIPHIIDLLQNDNCLVRRAAVEALSKLSMHGMSLIWSGMALLTSITAEFRGLIATSIPQIINLLKDDIEFVRWSAVAALSKFSAHGMSPICSGMAPLMSIAAEFRDFIAISIPRIIDLLQDYEPYVSDAVDALSELSKHGMSLIWSGMVPLTSIAAEFRGLIATSIPQIINLLKDNAELVRDAAVRALSKLSEHSI
jgi:HEAT repeat protein